MRADAQSALLKALGDGRSWLDDLLRDPQKDIASIAMREGKTERSIRMTVSLAFVDPQLVAAAVDRRLPRGFGIKRLVDPPMLWLAQWRALGLVAPGDR